MPVCSLSISRITNHSTIWTAGWVSIVSCSLFLSLSLIHCLLLFTVAARMPMNDSERCDERSMRWIACHVYQSHELVLRIARNALDVSLPCATQNACSCDAGKTRCVESSLHLMSMLRKRYRGRRSSERKKRDRDGSNVMMSLCSID